MKTSHNMVCNQIVCLFASFFSRHKNIICFEKLFSLSSALISAHNTGEVTKSQREDGDLKVVSWAKTKIIFQWGSPRYSQQALHQH